MQIMKELLPEGGTEEELAQINVLDTALQTFIHLYFA